MIFDGRSRGDSSRPWLMRGGGEDVPCERACCTGVCEPGMRFSVMYNEKGCSALAASPE
jgi:hypothetical protein